MIRHCVVRESEIWVVIGGMGQRYLDLKAGRGEHVTVEPAAFA